MYYLVCDVIDFITIGMKSDDAALAIFEANDEITWLRERLPAAAYSELLDIARIELALHFEMKTTLGRKEFRFVKAAK